MNSRRTVRRLAGLLIHNWPLKLAAIVLATLLYAGLVASQGIDTIPGPLKITAANQPEATTLTSDLGDIESIQFTADAGVPRPRLEDFTATVDLADVTPDGNPVTLRVEVTSSDPRIVIYDTTPKTIRVVLDRKISKAIPVTVDVPAPPGNLTLGDITVVPARVTVTGASALVDQVVRARVGATIDASGLDIDRDVRAVAVDTNGQVVNGVELSPSGVHLSIPVIENLDRRSLPVTPVVTGTPGAGFRIAAVSVEPKVITVEGDAKQLTELVSADTAPVAVTGATRNVTMEVEYALPSGVSPVGVATARVTVTIEPVTETRTFEAGIRLDGRDPDLLYSVNDTGVLLTLFGSTADLDTLGSSPIVISVNVAGLEPGVHEVPVVPSVPSNVTVAAIDPGTIAITVSPRPTPTPAASPAGTPGESTPTSTPTP